MSKSLFIKLLLAFTFLMACSPSINQDASQPTETSPLTTESPTQTKALYITQTQMPVPTIAQEIREMNIKDLLISNGGCDYPCWWGIAPGEEIQDVTKLSQNLGESVNIYKHQLSYTVSFDSLNLPDLVVTFFEKKGIVKHTEVNFIYISRHPKYHNVLTEAISLNSILRKYGKPSKVLFLVEPRIEPNSPIVYALFLAYNELGFSIEYSGRADVEDPIRVCSIAIKDYHLQEVNLFMQNPANTIQERNQFYTNEFQPLELYTSMNSDKFYEAFLSPQNDICIETSLDNWQ